MIDPSDSKSPQSSKRVGEGKQIPRLGLRTHTYTDVHEYGDRYDFNKTHKRKRLRNPLREQLIRIQ